MGLFGAKVIYWSPDGDVCLCCLRVRDEWVHFGLGAAFDPSPGLCTYCWRRGHQHRSRPCVDQREFVFGKHPNEKVKLNGRTWLWAQVLEAALEDDVNPPDLPTEWVDRRFPPPKSFWQRLFGGQNLLTVSRRLPHPIIWNMRFDTREAEHQLAELRERVEELEARTAASRSG